MDDYRRNVRHDDFPRITTPALARGFVERRVRELSAEIGEASVVLAYSGGVCSTVCAALIREAIGDRLNGAFVDLGLRDRAQVIELYKRQLAQELEVIDARADIGCLLDGVSAPEEKSRVIGAYLVEAFRDLAIKHNTRFVATDTTYPDILKTRRNQPSHHSMVHEPLGDGIELVEPVKLLFSDEVLMVARLLSLNTHADSSSLPSNTPTKRKRNRGERE
ncbi:MAG: hypothetical protein Q4A07_00425 [Coriobacteriales bacterium]|nr:hypothetical protein [Coriobacteriales bacterium]